MKEYSDFTPSDGHMVELNNEDQAKAVMEGCINCEFIEYREGTRNYCSEHERFVKDDDPPCKAYVEQGSY